jgi:hypothetical protein
MRTIPTPPRVSFIISPAEATRPSVERSAWNGRGLPKELPVKGYLQCGSLRHSSRRAEGRTPRATQASARRLHDPSGHEKRSNERAAARMRYHHTGLGWLEHPGFVGQSDALLRRRTTCRRRRPQLGSATPTQRGSNGSGTRAMMSEESMALLVGLLAAARVGRTPARSMAGTAAGAAPASTPAASTDGRAASQGRGARRQHRN